jgi:glycyl-tRNA synthetase beta chain
MGGMSDRLASGATTNHADFLLELRSEEIPARMQDGARKHLQADVETALANVGLAVDGQAIQTFSTPRRLALIAHGLPLETQAVSEETKGPKVGAPPQALEGFLRKTGLTQDQLTERDGVYFAVIDKPGRKTADVLAEAIPAIIRAFSWPKSMRWGTASVSTESLRWVRPLQGIVALLGDDVVPCEIDGIASGRETMGHRFMGQPNNTVRPELVEGLSFSGEVGEKKGGASTSSAQTVVIENAATYADQLRAAYVIVDQAERRAIIRDGAAKAAAAAGLTLVPDEALVAENEGLTEWPVPLLGRFDAAFLALPPEVIRLTAKLNQKYFMCEQRSHAGGMAGGGADADGKLANAFVCTANISARDGGLGIIAGNERVLAARLSDAKFFYEQDLKTPLAVHAEKLKDIIFHEKLGTVADKVERVAKLARWLVESGVISNTVRPEPVEGLSFTSDSLKGKAVLRQAQDERVLDVATLADMAETAARLCKADLVTGMVGEFPELQGVMGGYYARAQGLPSEVADAIRDQYKPVGQGDDVPTAPVTVALSLADKLDTLVGFFGQGMPPTGSKDPFALRRQTLGIIALITQNGLRLPLSKMITGHNVKYTWEQDGELGETEFSVGMRVCSEVLDFLIDRLKVQQKEAGVRHDLIDAVTSPLPFRGGGFGAAGVRPGDEHSTKLGGEFQQTPTSVLADSPHPNPSPEGEGLREDDLVRLLARVKALQGFITSPDGANLLAGYKRAANILKAAEKDRHPELVSGSTAQQELSSPAEEWMLKQVQHDGDAEADLLQALNAAEPQVAAALAAENFTQAMSVLATLRAPIDRFFTDVMVNDPDPAIRAFRLGLLARFRDAVHRVADFSKIEG